MVVEVRYLRSDGGVVLANELRSRWAGRLQLALRATT